MAKKTLKLRIAQALNLITPDVVLAIEPEFAKKTDQAETDGNNALSKAQAMTNQANALLVTASGHRNRGTRKLDAVQAFRKASGG